MPYVICSSAPWRAQTSRRDVLNGGPMATAAQEVPALKRAVKEIENRLDAFEGTGLAGICQAIREAQSSNDALFKVAFRQIEHLHSVIDKRFDAVMAQFEKLLAQPSEN